MRLLIEILLATFLLILVVLAASLGVWAHQLAPVIDAAVWNFASSSWDVKQNSGEELQETRKATAAAKALFDHTDVTLNGPRAHPGLIPQLTALTQKAQPAMDNLAAAVGHLNTVAVHLDELVQSGTGTTQQLTATVQEFQRAIADVDGLVADPKIRETIANLAAATNDLDASIRQLNEMLKSGTATAQDVQAVADKVREQYTKARNLYYAIFKELLSIGSEGVQFVLKK